MARPPLDGTGLKARILRVLLVAGEPIEFYQLREAQGLYHVGSRALWRALRELANEGLIASDERLEVTQHEGFPHSMTFPVFWVPREPMTGPDVRPRAWWRELLTHAGGEGVAP